MKNYTVVRTDNMHGTDVRADLLSMIVVSDDKIPMEVENGVIVTMKNAKLKDGEREVYEVKFASASSDIHDMVLVASPEVVYDERLRNLDDFINEENSIVRGYRLYHGDMFSVTKEGFVGGSAGAVDSTVGVGSDGKILAGGTNLGKIVAKESAGRYEYFVIQIA